MYRSDRCQMVVSVLHRTGSGTASGHSQTGQWAHYGPAVAARWGEASAGPHRDGGKETDLCSGSDVVGKQGFVISQESQSLVTFVQTRLLQFVEVALSTATMWISDVPL